MARDYASDTAESGTEVDIAQGLVPLEPRVLMDATLGWDISGTDQVVTLVSGVHHMIEQQIADYGDFLDQFDALASGALSTLDVLSEANAAAGTESSARLDEMIGTLRDAIAELQAGSLRSIEGLLGDQGGDTFEAALAEDINDALAPFWTNPADTARPITEADIAATFNLATITGDTLSTAIGDLVDAVMADPADYEAKGLDAAELRAAIDTASNAYFEALLGSGFEVRLEDIEVGGQSLVAFDQNLTDPTRVDVEVTLPGIAFDFDALFDWAAGAGAQGFDLDFDSPALSFSFQIGSYVTPGTGNAIDGFGIHIDELDFAPLAEFGGVLDVSGMTDPLVLGMLSLGIDAISTAEIRVEVGFGAGTDLGVGYSFAGGFDWFGDAVDFDVTPMIREVGGADFEEVADDTAYALAQIDLSGALDFFSSAEADATEASYGFAMSLALSSTLSSGTLAADASVADRLQKFLADAQVGMEVDLSGSVADAELRATLEDAIESLAAMGMDQVSAFLSDLGAVVSGMMRSAMFDVDIPFTDIEIATLLGGIGDIFSSFDDLFHVSTEGLGFGVNDTTMFPIQDEVTEISFDFDPASLAGVTGFDLRVLTSASTGLTLPIDVAGDATLSDPDASDEDKAGALAALLNAALSAYGYAVAAVGLVITISSPGGAGTVNPVAITGARKQDGSLLTSFGFDTLGLDEGSLYDATGTFQTVPGGYGVTLLGDTAGAFTLSGSTLTPSAGFVAAVEGQDTLTFQIEVDGATVDITVDEPETGWLNAAGTGANLLTILTALRTGIAEADLPLQLQAGLTAGFDGITLQVTETDYGLRLVPAQTGSSTPGPDFAETMVGVEQLVFSAERGGEVIDIIVEKPASGWYDAGTNEPNLQDIADAIMAAVGDVGLPVEVTVSGGALTFAVEDDAQEAIKFGLDPEKLTRAFDLASLIEFVNVKLAGIEGMGDATLRLTEDGALVLGLEELTVDASIGTGDGNASFDLSGVPVAGLADLSLSARLSAAMTATFGTSVGIDILGFAAGLLDKAAAESPENALAARREIEAAEDETTLAKTLGKALSDNVFFLDMGLSVDISAEATNITGSADLGIAGLRVGASDASQNFMMLDTQFDMTVVGTDADAMFNDRVSLTNIIDAFLHTDADGAGDMAGGLNRLVGRTDLQGGIVTDGAGHALTAGGDAATTADAVRRVDADAYVVGADEVLSQMFIQLGDVKLDVVGISGINEGILDGVSLSIDDLTDPLAGFGWDLLGPGAEQVRALTTLGEGDILDSLETILDLVSLTGEALKEKLPFLDQNIPLLNFSLLDTIDFAKDLTEQMQEMRDEPQVGLDKLDAMLESVFGEDTVTLSWDADAKVLGFALSFRFLEDYSEELPFNFDLKSLIGDQLASIVGADAADILTNLADVRGDGALIFDPDLSMDFAFGLDLSQVLLDAPELATLDTALTGLGSVSNLVQSAEGANDLRIRWNDVTTGQSKTVNVDTEGAETLGDLVTRINDALQTAVGTHVSFTFDPATGQITLADGNSFLIDAEDVTAMFGGETALAEAAEPAVPGDFEPAVLALDAGFADFGAALSFHIAFGADGDSLGAGGDVVLAADAGRDTAEALAAAINAALDALDIDRREVAATSVGGWTLPASQLVRAEVIGDVVTLVGTNFAQAIGKDAIVFGVSGVDVSHEVRFTVTELGGSNAGRMLGLTADGLPHTGDMLGEALTESQTLGKPRLFLDTEATGLSLTLSAGAENGLNLKLALGPLSVGVVNGTAMLTAGQGSTDPAHVNVGFNDVDGDAHDGEYNLADLIDLATDSGRSFLDLINLDVAVGLLIDLPFQDNIGFLNPADHGLRYDADLITTGGAVDLASFVSDPLAAFSGDVIALSQGEGITGDFTLNLPSVADITAFLADFNVLAFLNDPIAVLDGLDMILNRMQSMFDEYLGNITLPVVGDAIGSAVTFFDDFRFNVLESVRVAAETPKADGSMPTTVDLMTGFLNDKLNEWFNAGNEPITFIQAALNTDGALDESYLYGTINFGATIFDEMLDIAFELGIPGFELDVKQGSRVRVALDYTVNLGFGLNKNGFFLLNDTDHDEITIGVLADAGSFQGSAKLLGVLGVNADAVTEENGSFIGEGNGEGTAKVSATLGAALYGDQGLTIVSPGDAVGADEIAMDLSGIQAKTGAGADLDFEKALYVTKIDASQLIAFSFTADIDIQIGLEANILDPTTGDPLLIAGSPLIPSVRTELVVAGHYASLSGEGFVFDELSFKNVRIDANVIYEAFIEPIVTPIKTFIDPLADALGWLNEVPFSFVTDALAAAFPIFGVVKSISDTIIQIDQFVDTLDATGGQFIFGDFDLISSVSGDEAGGARGSGGGLDASTATRDTGSATPTSGSNGNPFGVFGNLKQGFAIEIPLLSDPFSAINLLTGKFDQVDLIKVHATLLNLDFPRTSLVDLMLNEIGAPGWVSDIISGAFRFEIGAHAYAGLTAGYDLSGIVNFVNTLDPERLLDGVFLDAGPFLDLGFDIYAALNLGIAGLEAGGGANIAISFNDPNDDGKLRIPELVAILDASIDDPSKTLGYLFEGRFDVYFFLKVWAGISIDLGLFSIDLKWRHTVVDINESLTFGGFELPPRVAGDIAAGETAILAVGSNIGNSMSNLTQDGNDRITLSGPNSPIQVQLTNQQGSLSGSFSEDAGGIIIPAGNGDNTVDLSGLYTSGAGKPVVVYAGDGNDTIKLPDNGITVVFAGAGNDRITSGPNAKGTYVIFGEAGSETVDIKGGNVIFIGDSDMGMRDVFLTEFATGGLTDAKVRALLGINADGTVTGAGAQQNYNGTDANGNAVKLSLAGVLADYTRATQIKAASEAETVTLGGGNHVVLTGGGADKIIAGSGATGVIRVLSGAGDDTVTIAGGADALVEGGAGSDRLETNAAVSTLWGWGAAAGEAGQTGNAGIDTLALRDGTDVLVGGAGNDTLHGQLGNDLIVGGMGNDTITGGKGVDILVGGLLDITTVAGAQVLTIDDFDPVTYFGQAVILSARDLADGDDVIRGGTGADLLLGGGGGDTLSGGDGNDAVVGDFAQLTVAQNLLIESVDTQYDTSLNAGTDTLGGDAGNDILIAGGSSAGAETVIDLQGSNTVLGDFGILRGARLSDAVTFAQSKSSSAGGDDIVTTGEGNDLVIGGEGNDTLTTGLGSDIVLGDLGTIDVINSTITGIVTAHDGDDIITVGNGTGTDITDIVIGGAGDDRITAGSGGLILLGDNGVLTLDPAALLAARSYIPPGPGATPEDLENDARIRAQIAAVAKISADASDASDGDDTVNAGTGFLNAVMGGGADHVTLSDATSYVLGDNGSIEILDDGVLLTAVSGDYAGDDTIIGGAGDDLIIGGLGADTISSTDGADVILGDDGTIRHYRDSADDGDVAEATGTTGGDDVVTITAGAAIALLGTGADRLTAGNGGVIGLGDTGTVTRRTSGTTVATTAEGTGVDTLTSGSGDDILMGGDAGDVIDGGDGDNVILGDFGSFDSAGTLRSDWSAQDGDDSVTVGNGDNRVILGGGADGATLGNGDNRVIGDAGAMDWTSGEVIETLDDDKGGADAITGGNGDMVVLAGVGGDTVDLGDGAHSVLGDAGRFDAAGTLTSDVTAGDGDDVVTLGHGGSRVILGGGADKATLGNGDHRVLGDYGTNDWTGDEVLTSLSETLGGADEITTGTGDDVVFGGMGADVLHVGEGDNAVLGDAGEWEAVGRLTSDWLATDGDDTVTSGAGQDRVILGGGSDTAELGDGDNRVLG
ncbi:calcium-binding protein, partial [Maritimibacter sp. DP1N21-5]|uniref:beta strand repeat-containing protein n=1 Tax=Maritimibacter sp. DP1N21-5 TaxID=2836867 RepID=UPI00272EAA0C